VGIAEVAVGPSLGRFVAELLCDLQSFVVMMNGQRKVAQEVMNIPEIAASSTLGRLISNLLHEDGVLLKNEKVNNQTKQIQFKIK